MAAKKEVYWLGNGTLKTAKREFLKKNDPISEGDVSEERVKALAKNGLIGEKVIISEGAGRPPKQVQVLKEKNEELAGKLAESDAKLEAAQAELAELKKAAEGGDK